MRYSLVQFLRNFPLRYYLTGGLVRINEPIITVFLSPESSAALISRGRRHIGYEEAILELPDAPPLLVQGPAHQSLNRSFTGKLLSRWKTKGSPYYFLLPDLNLTDFYCTVHSTANLRESTVDGLLESLHEEPRQVIGSWDDTRSFRWGILDCKLQRIEGSLDRRFSRIFVVGIPGDYCDTVESWIDTQSASLLGIVPVPLACLQWFVQALPLDAQTVFLLVILANSFVLAAVQDREVILLRQYVEEAEYINQEVGLLAEELKLERPETYVWNLKLISDSTQQTVQGTDLNREALRQINGGPVVYRRFDGTAESLDGPIPQLLHWMHQQIV